MINFNHAVKLQHTFWQDSLEQAKVIVDATLGNGQDFLYLAAHASPGAELWGIDIQPLALEKSKELLTSKLEHNHAAYHFILGSHEQVIEDTAFSGRIDLLVFNLGYLPGGNHDLMTHSDTTIKALKAGLTKLNQSGLITIVAYPGTDMGKGESERVLEFIKTLPQRQYDVSTWAPVNQVNNPPILYIIKGR
ncbi:class I SAM-dependent methyltransferase [uncultured Veillonella sp.]|uniref:tRNA (mnm(5)s(2)U34)-methyltransferase n=1 Tax=uncultured Veillonella sp. TaxID=159268 RepID=UPI002613844E|nr:class I SAM-dependent methyltransferase [uncultured Veillonella sp.]